MWQNGCATLTFISARRFRPLGVANCFVPQHIHTHACVWLRLQPNNSCFNLHITLSVVCPAIIPISYKKSKCATSQCKLKGNTRKKNKPITDRISNCIINFALLLAPKQQQRLIKLEKRIEIKTSLQF